ncbi:hypothetical protein AC481_00755 [miscellaneous Crenarchaeota group archaeon SMTZ-80]|nr:MAG: hypothetical protein AC481_00755 [miscellaneous Crenarchaeota group archaeon SMTZ-80]
MTSYSRCKKIRISISEQDEKSVNRIIILTLLFVTFIFFASSDALDQKRRDPTDDTQLNSRDEAMAAEGAEAVLAEIRITPNPVTVSIMEDKQFRAEGFDQFGKPMAISPIWAAKRGIIDETGYYTASSAAGRVTVTAADGAVGGQATLFVIDSTQVWPTNGWDKAIPTEMGMDPKRLEEARNYALKGGGSGFITRGGKLVMSWGSTTERYDLKSTTKSIGATALGMALEDGLVGLNDVAQVYLADIGIPPESNSDTGWLDKITILHLATHTAGFDKPGGYVDLLFKPGMTWAYSDGGANWLADVLTVVYKQDLNGVMFKRVFTPLGIDSLDLTWRRNAYRSDTLDGIKRREFGSGIRADIDAMAKIGYLYLRRGVWNGERILPESFVEQAGRPVPSIVGLPVYNADTYFNASDHYGLLWWNNGDGTIEDVPVDAFWSWGLGDSLIVVIPSLDVVVARAGNSWKANPDSDYSVITPFLRPIALSVLEGPPDQAPEVTVMSPKKRNNVSGIVDIRADATDDKGVTKVEFFIDDSCIDVDYDAPYFARWNTRKFSSGTHTIKAKAYDTINQTAEDSIQVKVDQPPEVMILSPNDGARISGIVTIQAKTSDDFGIKKVQFYINGVLESTDKKYPYEYNWNTNQSVNDTYRIRVSVYDSINQTARDLNEVELIPHAPRDFTGDNVENRALLQREFINVLTWERNPYNKNIEKYRIYFMEGDQKSIVVELSADTLEYWHREVNQDEQYQYALVAVDSQNQEGDPAFTTVQEERQ